MKFGAIPVAEAQGALLAHSTQAGEKRFKKGRLLSAEDIETLRESGVQEVIAARLEETDVPEDEAAERIASLIAGNYCHAAKPFTGRANIIADKDGVALIDEALLTALNMIDESLTVATLPPFTAVRENQIIATIKIIPFAVRRAVLEQAEEQLRAADPMIAIAPFREKKAGLIMTTMPGARESLLEKTIDSVSERLESLGIEKPQIVKCRHRQDDVAEAARDLKDSGCTLIFAFGPSAIVDRRDVIPAGIEQAGGRIEHYGMPVDPGNLLLLASIDGTPVVGLPGCARSPKLNGFDWILHRLAADIPVKREDIMRMGSGGLLKEYVGRPQSRDADSVAERVSGRAPRIAGLVLAAGQSRRMGKTNKLLEKVGGKSMVEHVVDEVMKSRAEPVVVVTGYEAERVQKALTAYNVTYAHNPDFDEGLSTSLRTGLDALPNDVDGALICLADMPFIEAAHLDKLISAFDPVEGRAIILPTFKGKRGNPTIWSADFFESMKKLRGDVGARHLIGENADVVCEVELGDPVIFTDIDTPESLEELRREG